MVSKRNPQEATDAADLAAATSLARDPNATSEAAKELALTFFKGQIKHLLPAGDVDDILKATIASVTTTTSANGKRLMSPLTRTT